MIPLQGSVKRGSAMTEDNICMPWLKPFYYVWEAAAFWCDIMDRPIKVDENGLPVADPQNSSLRSKAEWIMDAINNKELPCGNQGSPCRYWAVEGPSRTVRRKDLRNWFLSNFTERPSFLFDETERSAHIVINPETFLA
jgi:hypothetical protein